MRLDDGGSTASGLMLTVVFAIGDALEAFVVSASQVSDGRWRQAASWFHRAGRVCEA
jgi:hypothetical protein